MSGKSSNLSKHIYGPSTLVDNTIDLIVERMDNVHTGIRSYIPGATFLNPWRKSELISIVGFTSNGKSSLANYIVNQHAYALRSYRQKFPGYNHIIAYITWEQAVEEQTIMDLSRITAINPSKIIRGELKPEELERLVGEGATQRKSLPIFLIGPSIKDDRRRTRLSMNDVLEIIIYLEENGFVLDMIVLDYLQRIKRTGSNDVRVDYMDIVDMAKDLTLRCPVLMVSQAKPEVYSRKDPLPTLEDSAETSNLMHSTDCWLSVWMPKQQIAIGGKLSYRGCDYVITDNTLVVGYLKQKMGGAPYYRVYEMGYGGSSLNEAQVVNLTDESTKRINAKKSKEVKDPQLWQS